MFTYFHKNKLRYEKGQLVPIFIVVLVVLIIMALVTLNLSKVASIRLESSNGVDAGSLAAGSVMANTFNAVAQTNSKMIVAYKSFYTTVSVEFIIALYYLIKAHIKADAGLVAAGDAVRNATPASGSPCCLPCVAQGDALAAQLITGVAIIALGKAIWAMRGIGITILAYSIAQFYFYKIVRKMALKGWKKAIEMGHGFNFSNSGTGGKLKEGRASGGSDDLSDSYNYKREYNDFTDGIEDKSVYTYSWHDGQGRSHNVSSQIHIDPVDTFDLTVTVLPSPVITATMIAASLLAYYAEAALTAAVTAGYTPAVPAFAAGCGCPPGPWICACWKAACAAGLPMVSSAIPPHTGAITKMTAMYPLLILAWAGLLPGPTITDDGSFLTSFIWIICWIDDIEHNRKVRADIDQSHQGANLGLWSTNYPATHDCSCADFRGMGSINEPVLRHDPSIIETDQIGGQPSRCVQRCEEDD